MAVDIVRSDLGPAVQSSSSTKHPIPRELTKLGIGRVCVELAWRYVKAVGRSDEQALAQLKGEFTASTCDPAWITTLDEYRRYIGPDGQRKQIPYVSARALGPHVIEIERDARIALASDWGTGAQPAFEVLRAVSAERPDVFIHLGDVYYSGTTLEYQANFLEPVQRLLRHSQEIPVFILSGNHDMYSGGEAFYNILVNLNPEPFKQRASFFCLRSADKKWQLLGTDTGLHDDKPLGVTDAVTRLDDDELDWHCARIEEFPGRTILLSHHQLFSAFSPIGPSGSQGARSAANPLLLAAFNRLTARKNIAAWFWGHEHTLGIYQPFAGLERGRCLGHGAVPVSTLDNIYKSIELETTPVLIEGTRLSSQGGVYNHGYAVLDLQGDLCTASYYELTATGSRRVFKEEFR